MDKKTLVFILGDYILIILFFLSINGAAGWLDVIYFVFCMVFFPYRLFSRDEITHRWTELIASLVLIVLLVVLTGGKPFVF